MKFKDLGLSYREAAHGVQSAIAYALDRGATSAVPKHLRTGIDLTKAEMAGLAQLLIDKGIFTEQEYLEAMRVGVNQELAMREEEIKSETGLDIKFR